MQTNRPLSTARSFSPAQAAQALAAAQRRLSAARQRLADVTQAEHPHVFVESSARKSRQLLSSSAADLKRPGVFGYGIGRRIRNGEETEELCATVFVERKRPFGDLTDDERLPEHITDRRDIRLPVDVVELGPFQRYAMLGSSTGPNDPEERGTIGAFATGRDGKTYAITAMHVSEATELNPPDPPIPFYVPSRMDAPNAVEFGKMVKGTTTKVDAGKILVEKPASALYYINRIGPLKGWRPIVDPTDRGIRVRLSGAASGVTTGTIVNPNVSMPELNLESAIVAQIEAAPGDSGAPLVDDGNLLLGTLVGGGQGSGLNVFSPIGLVLNLLDCEIVIPS